VQLDHRSGGVALALGYGLLVVTLFSDPGRGLDAATASVPDLLFSVVLPLVGLLSGGYVYRNLPFRTTVGFLTGSYLAVIAIALIPALFVGILFPGLPALAMFALAVFGIVATVRSTISALLPEF